MYKEFEDIKPYLVGIKLFAAYFYATNKDQSHTVKTIKTTDSKTAAKTTRKKHR